MFNQFGQRLKKKFNEKIIALESSFQLLKNLFQRDSKSLPCTT